MQSKQDYQEFCAAAPDLPVFHQPWFLDAVCGTSNWDYVVASRGGILTGVWPYFLKKKIGKSYVATPMLLRYLGPYLLPEYRGLRHENRMYSEMLEAMPKLAAFDQDMHPMTQNALPMHWADFQLHIRYSYVLDNIQNTDSLWKNLTTDYRNNKIPKADSYVSVEKNTDIEACYRLQMMSYERQGIKAPFDFDFFKNLHTAVQKNGQGQIFIARDKENKAVHAACFLIYDKQAAYYLMAGDDPDLRTSGAGILLAWEAIRYAGEQLKLNRFDFLGSMVEPIERVRRNFGAKQQPYIRLSKDWSRVFKLRRALR